MRESMGDFSGFDRQAEIPHLDGADLQDAIDNLRAQGYTMRGGVLVGDGAGRTVGGALNDGELGAKGADVLAGPYVLPGDDGEGTYFANGVGVWARESTGPQEIQEPQA